MLPLDAFPAADYSDPWDIPLPRRLRMLAAGRRRAAYFYEMADNSTFRYRVYNMAQVLNAEAGEWSASFFFKDDLALVRPDELAELADLLVICRTQYDHRVNHLTTAFRNRGKRVLFDVDDLVFNLEYAHELMSTLDQNLDLPDLWNGWFAYIGRIQTTLRSCDAAIATNEYLAEQIWRVADIPVHVAPNFLNREQLEVSGRIHQAKQGLTPGGDGCIRLGYFSGTPSHNKDFAMIWSALEELLEEDERLELALVGYIEAGPVLKRFKSRVRHHPFQDFVNLQRLIGSVEFNLMPLQDNTFTNCKSELKYFEAAIVGTVSIASPTFTYARAVRHGENGYLARAHQWASCIKRAVRDLDRYPAMAARAFQDARDKFAWQGQRERIIAALEP